MRRMHMRRKLQIENYTEVLVQYFRTCMWVAVDTIAYVRGLQLGESLTSVQSFLGKRRSIQDDIGNNNGDVSRPYRWSALDLWIE